MSFLPLLSAVVSLKATTPAGLMMKIINPSTVLSISTHRMRRWTFQQRMSQS